MLEKTKEISYYYTAANCLFASTSLVLVSKTFANLQ